MGGQQMNNIQLHVGYIGITREGKRVEITTKDTYGSVYPWLSSDGDSYEGDGSFVSQIGSPLDIVGPWVETPVEPQVNYNDGNWHRWDGTTAECPVHTESVVEVNYINFDQLLLTDSTYARYYNWDSDLASIVAFRVTKEYVAPVEPREFWVVPATGKCFMSKPAYTSALHVKEVTND
jgi:hypothetical protein